MDNRDALLRVCAAFVTFCRFQFSLGGDTIAIDGSKFTASAVREWLKRLNVQTLFIEPGSPWENGYNTIRPHSSLGCCPPARSFGIYLQPARLRKIATTPCFATWSA